MNQQGNPDGAIKSGVYHAETRGIAVDVAPIFLNEQSSPDEDRFVWAYRIRIENRGPITVQLRNRYWHITNANGAVQEVRGSGVVGKQPVLQPGEIFEYTSGAPLTTPSGIMVGHFEMVDDTGAKFEAAVPAFSLDSPHQAINLH